MIYLILAYLLFTSSVAEGESSEDEVYQLGEISVTPGRFTIDESKPSSYLIPKSDMEKLPMINSDIYRAAHTLPGVVADDFSARFSLRGGDRDEIITRLDGMELYDPYHLQDFGGAISIIDMGIVKRADLYMGGFSAEYGDAMSGVFDVVSSENKKDRFSGDAGVDLLSSHIILEKPFSNASYLLAARRGYIDLLMGLIESEEVFKPRYYDLYNKLSYSPSTSDKLSLHALYAGDSNEIDQIGLENDIKSRYWNGMIWSKWSHVYGAKMLHNLYLFYGKAGRNKHEGIDGIDNRSSSYFGVKGDYTYNILPSQVLKAGMRLQTAGADYDYFLRENASVNVKLNGWDANGYLQHESIINNWLSGNMGIRYAYQENGDYHTVMPRLAVAFRPGKDTVVRAAWGLYNQPVNVTNLPVEDGIDNTLPYEKCAQYILSTEYTPVSRLFLRTEAYYKAFDDLAGQIRDYGRKEQIFIPAGSGSARGIEFYLRHSPFQRFSYGLGYAISKSEVETDIGIIPRNFDRRHSLNLNADYALWADGWINAAWRYHSGDPYTDAWYEKVLSSDGKSYNLEKKYGIINGKRYPSYHSFDVRLTKNFQFRRWSLSFYLQIINLYNRKNVHEYSFEQMVDESGNIYYQKVTEHFLPILPALGLSMKF